MNSPIAASRPAAADNASAATTVGRAPARRYRISQLRFDARLAGHVVEANAKRVEQ